MPELERVAGKGKKKLVRGEHWWAQEGRRKKRKRGGWERKKRGAVTGPHPKNN
jgi:hypothetical protein